MKGDNEKLANELKILKEQVRDEKELHETEMKKLKNDALDRLSKSEESREAAEGSVFYLNYLFFKLKCA